MKSVQKGFTLIELMIVVAIIGILAAIAIPAYQDYVAKSQVSEGVATASALKVGITDFYQSQGAFPAAGTFNDANGGRYTATATHDGAGVITVTMRGAGSPVSTLVQGYSFTLTPTVTNNVITDWNCLPVGQNQLKYLPSGCQ
jgi:type IV pilus assembly protein PilA